MGHGVPVRGCERHGSRPHLELSALAGGGAGTYVRDIFVSLFTLTCLNIYIYIYILRTTRHSCLQISERFGSNYLWETGPNVCFNVPYRAVGIPQDGWSYPRAGERTHVEIVGTFCPDPACLRDTHAQPCPNRTRALSELTPGMLGWHPRVNMLPASYMTAVRHLD